MLIMKFRIETKFLSQVEYEKNFEIFLETGKIEGKLTDLAVYL